MEGHDLFRGETDVVVCDGFVGNIVLKTAESVAHAITHWLKQELTRNALRMLAALILRGGLKKMKQRIDPELFGGAPLLGVNGVCIIWHGVSGARAVCNGIRVAAESVSHQINHLIADGIRRVAAAA